MTTSDQTTSFGARGCHGASIPSGSTPSIRTVSELRDRARPTHLDVGRANARLNDCPSVFIQALVGGQAARPRRSLPEAKAHSNMPCVSVPYIIASTSRPAAL
jgi:hypothetical protein